LYGLKQSPRAWNQKLDTFLKSVEFLKSEADPSVYVTQVGDVKFFIVVYVDDLILVCNDQNKFLHIKEELSQKFEMKDLGRCTSFWGWRWKGIVINDSYASTKSNTSRKY
jgi:esterase/lipase superfamily enzyme